ncbi:hypothetical protein EV702DRAFT_1200855 [Suillus placidus]|uniref:DUF4100 domain-containing protein n=1 Tax=Suillus placidus TaxID=48579 RepID=A0A9P6ZQH2_9AGAM|nr:hypothetical protein EV702DRAFT_1200855 [Suillus placidus]
MSSDSNDIDTEESINRYEESDDEETDTEDDEAYAFPVERVTRNSTHGRRERFEEVFPHGQSKNLKKLNDKDKGKDKVPTSPAKKAEPQAKPKSTQPTPDVKTKPVKKRKVEQSLDKGWDSEDIVMDDVDEKKATEKRPKNNDSPFKPTLNPDRKTTTTSQRVSDIAAKVKPEKILETVLRTPIRLEVGELLGTSRELSGILANAIKPKSLPNDSKIEAHSVWTKTRGLLIKIAMHCDGQAINAIIDTGSQLNIINKHIWKTIINRPIDIAKAVSMNDANGGEGKLRGLVQNVPLDCGGVDHGSKDLAVRYKLLCTPDGNDPNWDFEPSTWITNMGKTSMYCEITEKLPNSEVGMEISEIKNHVTKIFENQLKADQIIQDEIVSKYPNKSDVIEIKEFMKSIKEAPKLMLRPAPFGLVFEKNSARHPKFTHTSQSSNQLTPRNMPEQIFDETSAEVADFLIQNSGNFQFSTSIHSDTLTLSFRASPLPSLSSNNDTNFSSLSYSPIQWEDWTDEPDGPNIVDTNGLVPAAISQPCAGSQDSAGKIPTEQPSKDLLPNGSGVYVFEGLTKTMPIPNIHHPPNGTKTLGNVSQLPNIHHTLNDSLLHNASFFSNVSHLSNDSHLSNVSHLPNVSHLSNDSRLSNISHFSNDSQLPNIYYPFNGPHVANVSHLSNDSHLSNVSHLSNDSHFFNVSQLPNVSHSSNDSRLSNVSHFSNDSQLPNVYHPLNGPHVANVSHLSNVSQLPNIYHPFNGPHVANVSHLSNVYHPLNASHSGNVSQLPNVYHASNGSHLLDNYLTNTTTTSYNYDTSAIPPVLSDPNEPCFAHIPTFVPDSGLDPHTDSLIPRIDAIADNVRVRDFAQESHQVPEVKTEPALEEGEILPDTKAYVPEGGHFESDNVCDALTMIVSRAAQDEHDGPFVNGYSRSSTASTPPYASPIISSPSVYSISDESIDVYYMNSSPAHSTHSLTYPITPPNSKAKLSTIYENKDEHMPSLVPSQMFAPESNVCTDANIEHPLPSPVPMSGTIPYRGITRADGRTKISFDGITHLEAQQHLTMKYAKYNDYVSGGSLSWTPRWSNSETYKGQYEDVNPFFSESENKHLNSYAAIVENHGEPILASKILEALLMPCPDEDTISALTESRLLDIGSVKDILRLTLDRDLVLRIARTGLTVISTSPFCAEKFEDPFYSKEWFILSDNSENPAKVPKSKGKKFYL